MNRLETDQGEVSGFRKIIRDGIHSLSGRLRTNLALLELGGICFLGVGAVAGIGFSEFVGRTSEIPGQDVVVHEEVPGSGSFDISVVGKVTKVKLTDKGLGFNPNFEPLRDASLARISTACSPLQYVVFPSRNAGKEEDYYLEPKEITSEQCLGLLVGHQAVPTPTS